MYTNKIIGVSGRAGSGKDSVGKVISEELRLPTFSFAQAPKEIVNSLLGWPLDINEDKETPRVVNVDLNTIKAFRQAAREYGVIDYCLRSRHQFKLTELVDILGLDLSKGNQTISPRLAWQLAGTEWGRNTISEDLWARLLPEHPCVVTDVRFRNEAKLIRDRGGIIIKVERSVESVGLEGHQSENDEPDYDYTFHNTTPLPYLKDTVVDFMEYLDIK